MTTATAAPAYRKEIVFDRETRDYAMYLDGELTGFARTYHEAEVTLDQLVFELLTDNTPEKAAEVIMCEVEQDIRHEQAAVDAGFAWTMEPSRSEAEPSGPAPGQLPITNFREQAYRLWKSGYTSNRAPEGLRFIVDACDTCRRLLEHSVYHNPTTSACVSFDWCDRCDRGRYAVTGSEPAPAPPVDNGSGDNYGGFRQPTADLSDLFTSAPRCPNCGITSGPLTDGCRHPLGCGYWRSEGLTYGDAEAWACPQCGRELPGADASCASCTAPTAIRYVSAGWDGKKRPDLAVIAAQVLLPLAHLGPAIAMNDDDPYLITGHTEKIAAPPDDHAIVTGLIDALNEIAVQLPARPDSIYATLHIDGEMYTVQHNGPPRSLDAVPTAPQYITLLA